MLPVAPFLTKALLLTTFVVNRFTNENILVRLNHGGEVRGSILRSEGGRPFYAFRGIPYAEPPVGELRFKAPVPKAGWTEKAFDATRDGPVCVQFDTLIKKKRRGQEDCLTINVYTPKLPHAINSSNSFTRRPVMVFFHGGGFVMGDGTSETYNPARMMDSGIVLVTLNYRLDALGFLSTEDDSSPGNYGLLDQVLALKWIRDNIELFGGDSNSVTIFGESAGGASVSYHLLSPLSKGLFHRAIAMSGSSLAPWAHNDRPLHWAKFVANATGCPTEPSLALVDCLRTLPALSLVKGLTGYAGLPFPVPFCPTTDGYFLPASPREMMKSSDKINHVSLMSGITVDEAAVFLWIIKQHQKEMQVNVSVSSEEFIQYMFTSALSNRKPHVVKMIMDEYFTNVDRENMTVMEKTIIDAASDGMFDMPHYEEVELMSEAGLPVFAYSYEYQADIYEYFGLKRQHGTSHGEDLFMLFDIQWLGQITLNAKDRKMVQSMIKLWTNFARTGNPTPEGGTNSGLPTWNPSKPGKMIVYHINLPSTSTLYDVRDDHRFQFWTKDIPTARNS